MARHFDRYYCGKCTLTMKLEPSEWLENKPSVVRRMKVVPENTEVKKGKKDNKKGKDRRS